MVTPGSKFVTVGGMVACDVHGKNHHKEGSFGDYIEWLEIITANGEIKRCSKKKTQNFQLDYRRHGVNRHNYQCSILLRPVSTSWIKQKL